MRFELKIKMDDDAFMASPEGELRRILIGLVETTTTGDFDRTFRDLNGNKVGSCEIIGRK